MHTKIRLFPKKIIYFALYFVKSLPFLVIQTTEGRKNLDGIKWMYPRFFATLRSALNDKEEH